MNVLLLRYADGSNILMHLLTAYRQKPCKFVEINCAHLFLLNFNSLNTLSMEIKEAFISHCYT